MKSMGAYYWYVKIPQCGYRLQDIAFYVQIHIALCTVVITSLLVCAKSLGVRASVKRVYLQAQWWLSMIHVNGRNQCKKYHLNRITKDSCFHINGLVQDCSNSSANALGLLHWSYKHKYAMHNKDIHLFYDLHCNMYFHTHTAAMFLLNKVEKWNKSETVLQKRIQMYPQCKVVDIMQQKTLWH